MSTLDQFREACRRGDWALAAGLELRLHATSQFKRGQLTPLAARRFLLSGNAYITVVNLALETRQTFRVRRYKKADDVFFVDALAGPDNNADYTALGTIKGYRFTPKSSMTSDHRVQAFTRVYHACGYPDPYGTPLQFPPDWAVYHEGRCGRCARRLTVPSSIEAGIGPECAEQMAEDGTWATPGRLELPPPKAPEVPKGREFMRGLFE
jgi:hypothetical protein